MSTDILIVGAGMAGASLAAMLAPHASVMVIEAEDVAGYHATGRSAAFWSESYGGPGVQPLTTASGDYLQAHGFLEPLGSLHIGRAEDRAAADRFLADFAGSSVELNEVDPRAHLPGLREDWVIGIAEQGCAYIDVAGLHQHYLAAARRAGATITLSAGLRAATRQAGRWQVETEGGRFSADILVNAAGAWADVIATRAGVAPLGLAPYRRTMAQLRTDPAAPAGMPHIAHIGGDFYFKPESGGRLWLSPHDEIPTEACDAAPEEIDIAIAIDRFEHVVDWRVAAVERRWAGLRTFAPDRLPVYGFDAGMTGFFWCAGQGGFGIQTAPAAAWLAAALVLGEALPAEVAAIDPLRYSPSRFNGLAPAAATR
ncbi:FAD-binding oxidoreductase [Sphingomonas sp.]|uniref:NAD(P)/FAD-dependent oxidoreductase n=1 Tax=Sphingomonas sp. TaxID=28214 RepID=UPI001D9F8BB1|nr:FAD-dependent oxidoreductase [Sphingomonas sp.]MBX9797595.1 FAD-binding oxidoreductase [Sphingomonas sp.]